MMKKLPLLSLLLLALFSSVNAAKTEKTLRNFTKTVMMAGLMAGSNLDPAMAFGGNVAKQIEWEEGTMAVMQANQQLHPPASAPLIGKADLPLEMDGNGKKGKEEEKKRHKSQKDSKHPWKNIGRNERKLMEKYTFELTDIEKTGDGIIGEDGNGTTELNESKSSLAVDAKVLEETDKKDEDGNINKRKYLRKLQEEQKLKGNTSWVHDPCMIQVKNPKNGQYEYLVYSTHDGIQAHDSATLEGPWKPDGAAFPKGLGWANKLTQDKNEFWAPDISRHNGQYYLYYSVPIKGGTHSAVIGVATSQTGLPGQWDDHGGFLYSNEKSDYNAIDPNLFVDSQGKWWLTFGSFWSGIQQVELDPRTGKLAKGAVRRNIASRPFNNNPAIEGPFLYNKFGKHYLFVSFDKCCHGKDSTYSIHVGISRSGPNGPFYGDNNVPMLRGGSHRVLATEGNKIGPGGQSVINDPVEGDILVHHYYDGNQDGIPIMDIKKLEWKGGWPTPVNLSRRRLAQLRKRMKNRKLL